MIPVRRKWTSISLFLPSSVSQRFIDIIWIQAKYRYAVMGIYSLRADIITVDRDTQHHAFLKR